MEIKNKLDLNKVTILMSVYNPNINYLKKQLISLNNQDYPYIDLIIWDDCPGNYINEDIVKSNITKFPYKIVRAKENVGYIKAFEKLTELASGEFVAYCDQDDIWESNKISVCVNELKRQNAVLSTCDRAIIDVKDNVIEESIRHHSKLPEHTWNSGDDITKYAVFSCYTTGMTIVMKTDIAKRCLPFPESAAHDKWLGMCASVMGKVLFIDKPLVKYRRHNENVSGILSGINSKQEYYEQRTDYVLQLAETFIQKFPDFKDNQEILGFAKARYNKNLSGIFKYRYLAPRIAKFEVIIKFIPDFLFKKLF